MSSYSINNNITPSLKQGKLFNKYQNKIQNNLEKQKNYINFPNNNSFQEGYQDLTDAQIKNNGLTKQTTEVINKTKLNSDEKQNLDNLRSQYNETLQMYQGIQNQITIKSQEYLDRVSSSNKYLNNVIRFSNGSDFYVTNVGVARPIPDPTVLASIQSTNPNVQIYDVNIPYKDEYSFSPGTTIPTSPTLESGTEVQLGQTLGNEGTSVYVNSLITSPQVSYLGCYADDTSSPLMSFIGGSPAPANIVLNNNFNEPLLPENTYMNINYNSISGGTSGLTGDANVTNWYVDGGTIANQSTAWGFPMPYPTGPQCFVVQYTEALSQTVSLSSGIEYTLSFWACCRPNYTQNGVGVDLLNVSTGASVLVICSATTTIPSYTWEQYSFTFTYGTSGNYNLYIYGSNDESESAYYAIQGIMLSNGTGDSGTYSYESCQQAAINNEYQYFALQSVNTETGLGYCAVSNNEPNIISLGNSYIPSQQTSTWWSGTSGTGNSAILTFTGTLSVVNSSGSTLYSTPGTNANPTNYYGCYGDSSVRAMTLYNGGAQEYDLAQCQQIAQDTGYSLFALQDSTSGTNAQCTLSNDFGQATEYGLATNCTQISGGTWSGGGWSNAIYNTNLPQSNYYLILGDDGSCEINRGTSPSDNQGNVWSRTSTVTDANSAYAAKNGINGQYWMSSGTTLAPGDFLGSPSGYLALIMQTTGNLELVTFEMVTNCSTLSGGYQGGGVAANAIYNIGEVGVESNLDLLGYVDKNSELHTFPSSNIQYSNNYSTTSVMPPNVTEIPGAAFANATNDTCQSACNSNPNCIGYDLTDNNVCYPYTSTTTEGFSMRNKIPYDPPKGIYDTTSAVDSVSYTNYVNGGGLGQQYGLAEELASLNRELSDVGGVLSMIAQQIAKSSGELSEGTHDLNLQSNENIMGIERYLSDISKIGKQIEENSKSNLDHILDNSDIVILQKNYSYLFWGILSICIILIMMNILKS